MNARLNNLSGLDEPSRLSAWDELNDRAQRGGRNDLNDLNDLNALALADGRALAWAEAGDPEGLPVMVCHGLPGSRLQRHPEPALARERGVRLIHVDRPGFGHSTAHPMPALGAWAADLAALADALGIGSFSLAGISAGGPFALACAQALGDRVRRVALISAIGPQPGMDPAMMATPVRLALRLAPHAAWSLRTPLALAAHLARRSFPQYIAGMARGLCPSDQAVLARPAVQAMIRADVAEAFRQGVDAMLRDLQLLSRPWGFALGRIGVPVMLWHGDEDRVVPASAALEMARLIPGAGVWIAPGAGHFAVFDLWPQVLDWLAGVRPGTAG